MINLHKIKLIISREYLSRVQKKSFWVGTFLGPLAMAMLIVIPVLLTQYSDAEKQNIAVYDETGKFGYAFVSNEDITYRLITSRVEADELKTGLPKTDFFGLLTISDSINPKPVLISTEQPSFRLTNEIEKNLEEKIHDDKLKAAGIAQSALDSLVTNISLKTTVWKDGKEEQTSTPIMMAISFIGAIIIYMFTFIYGAQVMRGVIEEKTNRIIEVMISSVRPFELMMGKVLGIALVAITQFTLWIVLSTAVVLVAQTLLLGSGNDITATQQLTNGMNEQVVDEAMGAAKGGEIFEILESISNVPWGTLLSAFLFYFISGYLLYASLFAAIGAAVDNETDTQQFMLPITIPLILAFVMAQTIIENPDGPMAFWLSVIPFTSPIIMLVRLPFGVPGWELAVSMAVLLVTFVLSTWFAAKIYRVGILMYGKKPSYAELWKWFRYKG